jgi:hypothetical protein
MIEECSVCHSRRLVRSLQVRTEVWRGRLEICAPGGPLNRGESIGSVRGVACVDCGTVQWLAVDRSQLLAVYEAQQADSVQLGGVQSD